MTNSKNHEVKSIISRKQGEPTQWEAFNDITHSISNGKYTKTIKGNRFNPKFESVANYMKHTQLIFNLR